VGVAMIEKHFIVNVIRCCFVIIISLLFCSYSAYSNEIHDASKIGDLPKVKELIGNNHDLLSSRDERGITPLYYAAMNGQRDVVDFLIQNGCDINESLKNGMTPLCTAAFKHYDIVSLLIEKGADVNHKTYSGDTALHFAVLNGNYEITKILLDNGANVNDADNEGNTPLFKAVMVNKKEIVDLLVQRGADVNSKNQEGCTPLHSASMQYPDDISKLLERHGAVDLPKDDKVIKGKDLPFIVERLKQYPLHYASWKGDLDRVKTILNKNPELLNSKDYSQSTPLLVATVVGKVAIVKFLLDQGADVTLSNNIGWVPEVAAAYTQQDDLVKIISKYSKREEVSMTDIMKYQPFIPEQLAKYPIHNAALNGDLIKVKSLLLKNPSLINSIDYSQSTPLLVATYAGKKNVMQFLLKKGADVYISNKLGITPATVAALKRRIDLLEMIKRFKKTISKNDNTQSVINSDKLNDFQEQQKLYNVIYLCDIEGVDLFLKEHPEYLKNEKLNSLLINSCVYGDKSIIEYFVKKGAAVNAREWGWTSLHKAVENNNIVAVKTLLDLHADINSKAFPGYTPLHLAAKNGYAEIVDLLIMRGADVNAHDDYGDTPLCNALQKNNKDVIKLIRKAGGK
jgi:serine/threonine-protein phosphatase 6 regulatory ankyrin repeat subunit B